MHSKDSTANSIETMDMDAKALVPKFQIRKTENESKREELKRLRLEDDDSLATCSDLFGFAPIGLFAIDRSSKILEVNQAGARLLGVSRPLLQNRLFKLFVAQEDQQSFDAFSLKMLETSTTQKCELRLCKGQNESAIYVHIDGIAHEDRLLGEKMLLISVNDITGQKKSEKRLFYQANLLKFSSDAAIAFDSDRRITFWNPAAERIYGWKAEEVLGKTPNEIFLPSVSSEDEMGHEVRKDGIIKNVCVHLRKDGTPFWVESNHNAFFNEDGNIEGYVAVNRDITESKRTEEALKQSEEKSRLLIKYAPTMIYELDFNGLKFKNVNDEMCRTLGYTRDELLAMNPFDLLEGESKTVLEKRIKKTMAGEKIKDFVEYKVRAKDGRLLYGVVRAAFLFKDGQPEGALVVAHDVTDRKQMEKRLAQKVLERTEELSKAKRKLEAANKELQLDLVKHEKLEAQLLDAKEAAEAAARVKSEFLANMSHEIRTPMNAVIGLTGLLLRTDLTREQYEYVETIRSSGDALLSIINDILDFSKIDNGKMNLEIQPFGLRFLIEEARDLLISNAAEKGLAISYDIDSSTPETILGDPGRLRQIIVNLLSNAVKFTSHGGIHISVSGRNLEDNRHEIHFVVKDTGIGIPSDKMNDLFQSFSQIDVSTSRRYGGTGLGLAISKKIVDLMGGRIWAESELGKGSIFHFTILAKASSLRPFQNETLTIPIIDDDNEAGKYNLRILLAEDNSINQKVMLKMLNKLKYRAEVAANGLEVLEALERQPYDVVLMDIQMPEMDGWEAAKRIRQKWPKWPKIIAITAYAMQGDRERCIISGMDDYISKPVKIEELSRVLKQITRKG